MRILDYCTENRAFVTEEGLLAYLDKPIKHYLDNIEDYISTGLGTYLQVPCTYNNKQCITNLHIRLDPISIGFEFSYIR